MPQPAHMLIAGAALGACLLALLARIGMYAASASNDDARARWFGAWLPLTLAAPLIALALGLPAADASNPARRLDAIHAHWIVFGAPALCAIGAALTLGALRPARGRTLLDARASAVGLVAGALACLIVAAGRIGFFEGQIMLTAGVVLLWMRLTPRTEGGRNAASSAAPSGVEQLGALALASAAGACLAFAARDEALRAPALGGAAALAWLGLALACRREPLRTRIALSVGASTAAIALLVGVGAKLTLGTVGHAWRAAAYARSEGFSATYAAGEVIAFAPQTSGFGAMAHEAFLLLLLPVLGIALERAPRLVAALGALAAAGAIALRILGAS